MKDWWKSRTIWINAAVIACAVLGAAIDAVRDALGPAAYLIVVAAVAIINVALRKITTQPLAPLRKRRRRRSDAR